MSSLRAVWVLFWFFLITLLLIPFQWLFIKLNLPIARTLPHYYHRLIARIMGLRIHVDGKVVDDKPVLLVANHISWMDIVVFTALTPLSFVAKQEVGTWPGVRVLANMQRTIFVDRDKKTDSLKSANEIADRIAGGDHVVLFPEGTSSDGNRVLDFKSSLFAAASSTDGDTNVQTIALAYTFLGGVPLGRRTRPVVAWYGDMEMGGHVWTLLKAGPLDVHVRIGEPVTLSEIGDRKALASFSEKKIRTDVADLLSLRPFETKRSS